VGAWGSIGRFFLFIQQFKNPFRRSHGGLQNVWQYWPVHGDGACRTAWNNCMKACTLPMVIGALGREQPA